MPYLTDAELHRELAKVEPESDALATTGDFASPLAMLGGMGGAALFGFLRSKLGDPVTGEWKIPGTRVDAEGAAFGVLAAVALFGRYAGIDAQWRSLAMLGAFGVGSHYAGELGRQFGRTGRLGMSVGEGLPPWDPSSYDPTQFGDPHADAQARGLSSSGV